MSNGIDQDARELADANELYWGSDESVNRIADRLGLSKGSLYAAIQPKPSDSMCPTCGGQLAYPNRTALERGTLSCTKCSHEFTVRSERAARTTDAARRPEADSGESVPTTAAAAAAAVAGATELTPADAAGQGSMATAPAPVSSRWLLGAALFAVGTGLLLSSLKRRK